MSRKKKNKNKNSVTKKEVNNEMINENEGGRIMSMLNGMMNNVGGDNMNQVVDQNQVLQQQGFVNPNDAAQACFTVPPHQAMPVQFVNPNDAAQAQQVLQQATVGGQQGGQQYIPVDVVQPNNQSQNIQDQQQGFVNPNTTNQAQFVSNQVPQQQGFVNPNTANQAQFVNPNMQQNIQDQQQGFVNPNTTNQAQFVSNQVPQQQVVQNNDKENDNMDSMDKVKKVLNDDNENNGGDTNNESPGSIIEEHPFISTAIGVVGGILLGKYFFDNDSTDSNSNIVADFTDDFI